MFLTNRIVNDIAIVLINGRSRKGHNFLGFGILYPIHRTCDCYLVSYEISPTRPSTSTLNMALVVPDKNAFQHILRLLNTNVDGKDKVMFALTKIKGVGRRYSNVVIKKADVDLNKRYKHPRSLFKARSTLRGLLISH